MFQVRQEPNCSTGGGSDTHFGLRVGSIFVILVGATCGALFPVLVNRSKRINIPGYVLEFAKYFGSGVIFSTAFIHLLSPALDAFNSPCLPDSWRSYPYVLALAMLSLFSLFLIEVIAFRWGTARLARPSLTQGLCSVPISPYEAHSTTFTEYETTNGHHHIHLEKGDEETASPSSKVGPDSAHAQFVSIAILEFGVVLHSVLIGLTLAVDEKFIILFVVLVFHQTFEGLGIGSRLALLKVDEKYNWVPIAGAFLYGFTTPVGIAAGLGVRTTYNPGTATASAVSGIMDAISAGILIYASLVELMAHDFLFNNEMLTASNKRLAFALGSMTLGAALMALLGKWA
ncbi:ZIP zinc/iron transport family [Thelephora ganbajun]|uniref:ZIP zinc/iron transport family n=1 Tax=Thelephora ganbajun TaxID=370292 RepID=A0ACB6ZAP3_THEGA|nr:ZIP zinc/iron transport family [Thelephora ganbajun]